MYHTYSHLSMDVLLFSGEFSSDFSVFYKNIGCRVVSVAAFFDKTDDLTICSLFLRFFQPSGTMVCKRSDHYGV